MTIETRTALIHEHKYDRLIDSNNSNDGKEIKHVQERAYKRKWSDKSCTDRTKKKTGIPKVKAKGYPMQTVRGTKIVETTHLSSKNGRM